MHDYYTASKRKQTKILFVTIGLVYWRDTREGCMYNVGGSGPGRGRDMTSIRLLPIPPPNH